MNLFKKVSKHNLTLIKAPLITRSLSHNNTVLSFHSNVKPNVWYILFYQTSETVRNNTKIVAQVNIRICNFLTFFKQYMFRYFKRAHVQYTLVNRIQLNLITETDILHWFVSF